ncbi:hypothetical protein [Neobacillus sp. YIM B06451]|uniref:hypothetical protein n=1 Tax=Neobacillus sp. YIM B06451 TaxID=3070994 RepID=UPI00292DF7D6|nr:hypothetical protein [Neobacillus sp. YIM B06451]
MVFSFYRGIFGMGIGRFIVSFMMWLLLGLDTGLKTVSDTILGEMVLIRGLETVSDTILGETMLIRVLKTVSGHVSHRNGLDTGSNDRFRTRSPTKRSLRRV